MNCKLVLIKKHSKNELLLLTLTVVLTPQQGKGMQPELGVFGGVSWAFLSSSLEALYAKLIYPNISTPERTTSTMLLIETC